jgi:hypothetical protein
MKKDNFHIPTKLHKKLISIKQSNDEVISWFFIQSFKDWALLHYNPVDYILDGYIFIPLQNIQAYKYDKEEKFKEKIILSNKKPINNSLSEKNKLIKYLYTNQTTIAIEKKKSRFYVWNIIKQKPKNIILQCITPKGTQWKKRKIKIKDINNIAFNSDYINCLKNYSDIISSE